MIWLAHILSEGDHRLNQVEPWVEKRSHRLEISTGQRVRALEWSDDRLGIVLNNIGFVAKQFQIMHACLTAIAIGQDQRRMLHDG